MLTQHRMLMQTHQYKHSTPVLQAFLLFTTTVYSYMYSPCKNGWKEASVHQFAGCRVSAQHASKEVALLAEYLTARHASQT